MQNNRDEITSLLVGNIVPLRDSVCKEYARQPATSDHVFERTRGRGLQGGSSQLVRNLDLEAAA